MKLCNNFRTHFHNINLQYLDNCSFSCYCFNSCSGRVVPVVWQHWWCISICFSLKHVPFCLWGPGPALSQWVSGPWRRHMWKYKSFLNVYSHVLKRAWMQTRAELSSMWLPRICSLIRRQVILLFLFPFIPSKTQISFSSLLLQNQQWTLQRCPEIYWLLEMMLHFQSELTFNLKSLEHSRVGSSTKWTF